MKQKVETQNPPMLSRRVLIVEDDRRLREMLQRAIRGMEFEPSTAASAEEALEYLETDGYGILIVDLQLPAMDGLQFCQKVREASEGTQLIILTGFGSFESAREAIRLDVVEFLTKPCSLAEIEAALDRALRRRMQQMQQNEPSVRVPDEEMLKDERADASRAQNLQDHERDCILEGLARHNGNREAAAQELGISVRTLYYRLKEYERQGYICR